MTAIYVDAPFDPRNRVEAKLFLNDMVLARRSSFPIRSEDKKSVICGMMRNWNEYKELIIKGRKSAKRLLNKLK